jgi:hypothetical protein
MPPVLLRCGEGYTVNRCFADGGFLWEEIRRGDTYSPLKSRMRGVFRSRPPNLRFFARSSDLGHQLKSAGCRCYYLHLTVTRVRFLLQEQHPY